MSAMLSVRASVGGVMRSTVYVLANGEYLVVSPAGIRTQIRPRLAPTIHRYADEIATELRAMANAIEQAGKATAPVAGALLVEV